MLVDIIKQILQEFRETVAVVLLEDAQLIDLVLNALALFGKSFVGLIGFGLRFADDTLILLLSLGYQLVALIPSLFT